MSLNYLVGGSLTKLPSRQVNPIDAITCRIKYRQKAKYKTPKIESPRMTYHWGERLLVT